MAIPVYLQLFKAAGIYHVVFDKSTVLGVDAETLRLVVGYSEKGPFNVPTYVTSVSDFINIYGDISKKLEKRGIYFHRLAIQALSSGPILALNLKKFSTETVGAVSINVQESVVEKVKVHHLKVEDIFDTTRFWTFGDGKQLIDKEVKTYTIDEDNEYPYQAKNSSTLFNVKINDEGKEVSTGYIKVCATSSKNEGSTIFIRPAQGNQVKQYDITVQEWYNKVGLEMPDFFEGFEQTLISDYFAEVYAFKGEFKKDQVLASQDLKKYFLSTNDGVKLRASIQNAYGDEIDSLNSLYYEEAANGIGHYVGALIPNFTDSQGVYRSLDIIFNQDNDDHNLMMAFDDESLFDGSKYADYINLSGVDKFKNNTKSFIEKLWSGEATVSTLTNNNVLVQSSKLSISETSQNGEAELDTIQNDTLVNEEPIIFTQLTQQVTSQYSTIKEQVVLPEELENASEDTYIIVDNDSLAKMFIEGDKIVGEDGEMAYVQNVGTFEIESEENITKDESTSNYLVKVNGKLASEIGTLEPIYLHGYTFANPKPKSLTMFDKLEWQNQILSAITDYKGLKTGLLNKSDIDYRYIVDTFESFVDNQVKSKLSLLAKEKDSCFAILNFPSAKSFVKCPYSSYTNKNGVFNVQYIVDGFNRKKAGSKKFTLPEEINGASHCAFYTPLKFSDGYVDTIIPSAGLVSNLFMEKYNSRHPYNIVAGPNYGSISANGLVGPDYNYSQDELQIIEPFGVNCMVYRPGFGTFINANQTAKQTPVSALSKVNVRELVIFLQDEIEKVLQSYQWEFNNPTTRNAILDKANQICEIAKANGGIQAYFNVMDESNNTNEIIDNEMAILSTHIEPGRGCGKMVQTLTLYRTGELSSSIIES